MIFSFIDSGLYARIALIQIINVNGGLIQIIRAYEQLFFGCLCISMSKLNGVVHCTLYYIF